MLGHVMTLVQGGGGVLEMGQSLAQEPGSELVPGLLPSTC